MRKFMMFTLMVFMMLLVLPVAAQTGDEASIPELLGELTLYESVVTALTVLLMGAFAALGAVLTIVTRRDGGLDERLSQMVDPAVILPLLQLGMNLAKTTETKVDDDSLKLLIERLGYQVENGQIVRIAESETVG